MDALLKRFTDMQLKLMNKKKALAERKVELKEGLRYELVFDNDEQVVSFIEYCKTVDGRFKVHPLNDVARASFKDQLFFTDTNVKE